VGNFDLFCGQRWPLLWATLASFDFFFFFFFFFLKDDWKLTGMVASGSWRWRLKVAVADPCSLLG
jgi:hypothetical protein